MMNALSPESSSTKNATKTRDPEMKQTRKGQQRYFGMKVHVGTDTRGVARSLTTSDPAQADITQLPHLLTGGESDLYGDKAYYKQDHKAHWTAGGGRYRVNKSGKRTPRTDAHNAARSRVRARVEHVFHVVKRLWGFATVRYRGLAKNTARAFTAFALSNLYLVRKRLAPHSPWCARVRRRRGKTPPRSGGADEIPIFRRLFDLSITSRRSFARIYSENAHLFRAFLADFAERRSMNQFIDELMMPPNHLAAAQQKHYAWGELHTGRK